MKTEKTNPTKAAMPDAKSIPLRKWPDLLDEHPEWAEFCPWKELDGDLWKAMLVRHPEYWERCPENMRRRFTPLTWAEQLLVQAPSLAKHCDFSKFYGSCWIRLLRVRPEFADKCDFSQFSGSDWVALLGEHPEFAGKCNFSKLGGEDWCWLLPMRPEFAPKCRFGKLDGRDWSQLLQCSPEFAGKCDFSRLGPLDWARLVRARPEFADKCDCSRMDADGKCGTFPKSAEDWVEVLAVLPGFAPWCDFSRFDAWHWADLLSARPEFEDRCEWGKFGPVAWELLLVFQPQFADRCKWHDLPPDTQAAILAHHPELAEHCTVRRFSGERLGAIVGGVAKEARELEVGWLALPDDGGPAPDLPMEQCLDWGRRKDMDREALRDYEAWLAGPDVPKIIARQARKLAPEVRDCQFYVSVEGNRWRGTGYCWTEARNVVYWGKSNHEAPPVHASGGIIPGAKPLESRFGPLVERYGKALSPAAWEAVLAEDPSLASRCPAGTLGDDAVERLLAKRPELAAHFGRTPPPATPDAAPDGFPALDLLRWAKRHDIVRRTCFAWTNLMRHLRNWEPENFVRLKMPLLHPFAVEIGLGETYIQTGFCCLLLADSRGRTRVWFKGLFYPGGEYYDESWGLFGKD